MDLDSGPNQARYSGLLLDLGLQFKSYEQRSYSLDLSHVPVPDTN